MGLVGGYITAAALYSADSFLYWHVFRELLVYTVVMLFSPYILE